MSKGRDRTVSQRPDGSWENKRNDVARACSVHKTQAEAVEAAKEMRSRWRSNLPVPAPTRVPAVPTGMIDQGVKSSP